MTSKDECSGVAMVEGSGEGQKGQVEPRGDIRELEAALAAAYAGATNDKNRMEAIINALPAGVAICNRQGGTIFANPAFEEVWGAPWPPCRSVSDYAAYQAFWADSGRPVQPEEWASARAVQHGETVAGQVMQICRFDGSRAWVLNSAAPVRDSAGKIVGSAVAIVDISAEKMAEEKLSQYRQQLEDLVRDRTAALDEERQRFRKVLDQLPAYLILLSPDYHVPFANRFFEERFGRAEGRRCFEYLFQRTEPCENCETFKVLAANVPHRWEWTGPDGRHYDIHDFPFANSDGSPLIMEVGIDITERKAAEAELQRQQRHLEDLVEQRTARLHSANERLSTEVTERKQAEESLLLAKEEWERTFASVPDLIAILDKDNRILRVNHSMAVRLGVTEEQCVGRFCYTLMHGTECPPEMCPNRRTLADGREHATELCEPHIGGDFLVTTTPLHDAGGRMIGSVHVARDITATKRAEAEVRTRMEEVQTMNAELTRFNRAAVDRELRMVQLKCEVNELCAELGRPPKYPLDFERT